MSCATPSSGQAPWAGTLPSRMKSAAPARATQAAVGSSTSQYSSLVNESRIVPPRAAPVVAPPPAASPKQVVAVPVKTFDPFAM